MRGQEHPPLDERLARLAARQHGVVSRGQLRGLGLRQAGIDRRVEAGRLQRIHRGVYGVGHRRLTRHGRYMAAVLACGPGAALSHRSALALWSLRPPPSGPVHVTVPSRGRRALPGIRVHTVRAPLGSDRVTFDAIPVTSIARTLLDYAASAPEQQLRLAIEAAERADRLDYEAIGDLLARSNGHHGATRLKHALAQLGGAAPWTQSEIERAMLALVRTHGLPEPQCNVVVAGELVDFHWPHARLVVEVDSYRFHRSRARFEDDRRRDAVLQRAGYRVIRITDTRLANHPEAVAELLKDLL